MSSFNSIEFYNPLYVLFLGLATFFGFIGFGLILLKLFRIVLESPWRQVAAALLGILSSSLLIQVVSMSGIATKPVLTGIWIIIALTGCFRFFIEEIRKKKITLPAPHGWAILPFSLLVLALVTNLLAALAPSTKMDELYQYMTLPSRIVNDHALKFYLLPWEGSIFAHMLFQISLTPLHAMGFPDAGNIVSWGLSAMLVWFGWYLATPDHKLSGWSYLALACLVTGIYPVIWNVTGGSYSMGDLSTAAAVVALLSHKELIAKTGVNKFACLTSFLVLCSVSSKVTLLPLGLAILLLMIFFIFRNNRLSRKSWWVVALYIVSPWIILYLPILVWTFLQSGSPYGPLLAGFFHTHSVYNLETIHMIRETDRLGNLPSLLTIMENILIYFPALLWIGILLFLMDKYVPSSLRLTGLVLLILQTLILVFVVIFDPRYYGGLLQGILILWVIYEERSGWKQTGRLNNLVAASSFVFLIPWLTLQIFYAFQFFPVATGIQDKMEFYHREIAFMKDYLTLDKMLPKDAVLLINGDNVVRMNINYAPRPVYLLLDPPPPGKKIFLFCINHVSPPAIDGYVSDSLVYTNEKAVVLTYRNPFRPSITGRLDVYSVNTGKH